MKSITESIIGRKGTTALSYILNMKGDPLKFVKSHSGKAHAIMSILFRHDGVSIIKTSTGIQKIYNNPSPAILKLGNWCAPKNTAIFPLTIPRRFLNCTGDDLRAICIEYTFQGDEFGNQSKWNTNALAGVISDGLSILPEFRNTIIFIFPHVRDGYEYKDPLYIANPKQPKKPILLNDIIGNDGVDKIVNEIIYAVF